MGKLFRNKIDIEQGKVYSLRNEDKEIGALDEEGYAHCKVFDIHGNKYNTIHQVIYAEANNLPKHLWPIGENGKQYEIDHIIPLNKGGTNAASNLRLVSHSQNNKNDLTNEIRSASKKGITFSEEHKEKISKSLSVIKKGIVPLSNPEKPIIQVFHDGSIKLWKSASECARNGYTQSCVSACCRNEYTKKRINVYKNCKWYFEDEYKKMLLEKN